MCDAGAEPNYEFSDLANAIEKARVDFGVSVDVGRQQLQALTPSPLPVQSAVDYPVAQSGFLVIDVDYRDGLREKSKLI